MFGTALFPGEDKVPAAKNISLTICTPYASMDEAADLF